MECVPRKAQGGSRHGGAKNVQRGHGDPETLAGSTHPLRCGDLAVIEDQARQRMRRHHLNALGDLQTRSVRVYDEGRNSPGAGIFAGAREQKIEIGNAAVRYPGLFSVDHVKVAIFSGCATERGNIGSGIWLRDGKRCGGKTSSDAWKVALLLLLAAESGDCPRTQSLHGKCKISQAGMPGQGLTDQAYRARVD